MAEMGPVVVQGQPVQMGGSEAFLGTMDGVFVRQQLEILELVRGCETKNRYNMVAVPQGTQMPGPGQFNSGWTKSLRDQASVTPLLKGKATDAKGQCGDGGEDASVAQYCGRCGRKPDFSLRAASGATSA